MKRSAVTSQMPRDFRLYLQAELARRCESNEKYSLRAYARSLRTAPSALSAILSGKRPITEKMKLRLGLALGLDPSKLVQLHISQGKKKSKALPETKFQQLALDAYSVIADWYHYAILELVHVEDFRPDSKWVAQALGITVSQVKMATERLERVGLLKIDGHQWNDLTADGHATNIHGDLTSAASRKLQRQILEKSIRALDELPVSVRNHTSMTMAIDPVDFPEATRKIATFRRDLCAFFERNGKPKQVYQLGISLYPLSQIRKADRK